MKSSIVIVVAVVFIGVFIEVMPYKFIADAACHRLRTKLDTVRRYCIYLCHMPEGNIRMAVEEDGTPCKRMVREGVCVRGRCRRPRSRKGRPSTSNGSDERKVPELTTEVANNP
ncbi:uncharacterized protein LOC142792331 [Rhipicephalus microplus]|uniref:uncharacterized protein LOC142792331 n=1 Tax=Rhipicephalus microplus TaxID=6941 RepID=UPI003F6B685D